MNTKMPKSNPIPTPAIIGAPLVVTLDQTKVTVDWDPTGNPVLVFNDVHYAPFDGQVIHGDMSNFIAEHRLSLDVIEDAVWTAINQERAVAAVRSALL
jgi:hypothetical protein